MYLGRRIGPEIALEIASGYDLVGSTVRYGMRANPGAGGHEQERSISYQPGGWGFDR